MLTELTGEKDYWRRLNFLSGRIWRTEHDLADGRIADPNGSIGRGVEQGRSRINKLVLEICRRFGVIPIENSPFRLDLKTAPPPPEGKEYYWSWYERVKREVIEEEYGEIICCACPLSEGVEAYIRNHGERIPCTIFPGILYSLPAPYLCWTFRDYLLLWNRQRLLKEIKEKSGDAGVTKFLEMENQLLLKAESEGKKE